MRRLNELDHIRCWSSERIAGGTVGSIYAGVFRLPVKSSKRNLLIIASAGDIPDYTTGWDHVSVSLPGRCPTWEEMCLVKDTFFLPTERAYQLHPRGDENISNHPYCLHIWRPVDESTLPVPPSIMVGIKALGELPLKG